MGSDELDFCFLAVREKETVPPAVSLAGLPVASPAAAAAAADAAVPESDVVTLLELTVGALLAAGFTSPGLDS